MPGLLVAEGTHLELTSSGESCRVEQFLGAGGEGEVYRVRVDGTGDIRYALKLYFKNNAIPEQWEALEDVIDFGPPDPHFIWPIDLIHYPIGSTFGYVMELRPETFVDFIHELSEKTETATFRARASAGFNIAESFLALHSRGLCYRDISFGNVFIEPATGEILICDNDHVAVNKEGYKSIRGTPLFMAPEIVRDEDFPNTQTDLHSLAVLLFYMFIRHHPMLGAMELGYDSLDVSAWDQLCGWNPIFIFDPSNESNRPVAGCHDAALVMWPLYPQFLRDLFTKAFTVGMKDGNSRVAEVTWKRAMIRLRDAIVYCEQCGAQNFFDTSPSGDTLSTRVACWSCGNSAIVLPYRLHVGREVVMLNYDSELYPHHTERRTFDFTHPTAAVTQHPANPNVWGLKNLSEQKWVAVDKAGDLHDVLPGRSVRLQAGVNVEFGRVRGEVRR